MICKYGWGDPCGDLGARWEPGRAGIWCPAGFVQPEGSCWSPLPAFAHWKAGPKPGPFPVSTSRLDWMQSSQERTASPP